MGRMKIIKLILIFMCYALTAFSGDPRWHYSLGLEFNPKLQLFEASKHRTNWKGYGYSVGPGFYAEKNNLILYAGLHYKWLNQQYNFENIKFDTIDWTYYTSYKSDMNVSDNYIDLSINAGYQFVNDKYKIRLLAGTTYSYHYRKSWTEKRENYYPPSTENIESSRSLEEWALGFEWRVAYYRNINDRISFKIEPSAGFMYNWIVSLNMGLYYNLQKKDNSKSSSK